MPRTIAEVIRNGIANGAETDAILAQVRADFPAANTTPQCVSYYRSEARRNARAASGLVNPFPRSPRTAATETFDASTIGARAFGLEFEFTRGRSGKSLDDFGRAIATALAAWPEQRVNVRDAYFHSDGTTWDVKLDGSCEFELATPRLVAADWPKVVAVLAALKAAGAAVDARCGVHVHHEANDFTARHVRGLVRLWGAFDQPLHESLPESRRDNHYARRIDPLRAEQIASLRGPSFRREIRSRDRYQSLNLTTWWRNGRVEVRSHHGTLDADKTGWWLVATQRVVDRARTGRFAAVIANVADARDRFSRFQRVVGANVARVFALWARQRNATYFQTLSLAEAA